MTYYVSPDSNEFGLMYNKREFQLEKNNIMYQEPFQNLLKNYISTFTPYNSILLFNGLGTGKTCSAISIAEGFKNNVKKMGKKIIVLVKNKNIEKNFINELMSGCSNGAYSFDTDSDLTIQQVRKIINKTYDIMTYGTFVSRLIGQRKIGPLLEQTDVITRVEHYHKIIDLSNTVIIVDEVHNITGNDIYIELFKVLQKSINYKLILLSATPVFDNPKEIVEISNLLNANIPSKILPIRNDLFKKGIMINKKASHLQLKTSLVYLTEIGQQKIRDSLKGKVSYLSINILTNPKKIEMGESIQDLPGSIKVVKCEMSEYQYHIYRQALSKDRNQVHKVDENMELDDFNIQLEIENALRDTVNDIEPVNQIERGTVNEIERGTVNQIERGIGSGLYKDSSDASTMVYPDSLYGKDGYESLKNDSSPLLYSNLEKYSKKLQMLLDNINKSHGPVFIYSNYVNYGGTNLLKQLLIKNGYNNYSQNNVSKKAFIVFNDRTTPEKRDRLRMIFNSKNNMNGDIIKVIIGSPIMSEGITLKNVKQVHILEPTWNLSRINQIIGRAVRNHSHDNLPENQRNVEIYKYVSVYPDKGFYIDLEKYILSEEKDRTNKKIERMLKEISFDCTINKSRNTEYHQQFKDNSPECDYQECIYNCLYEKNGSIIDESTYNINITNFETHDVSYINTVIQMLFKKHFIWNLNDLILKVKEEHPDINVNLVYLVLNNHVSQQIKLQDKYSRTGILILKGDYFIFNPDSRKKDGSIYDNFFNFTRETNDLTLKQFLLQENIQVPIIPDKIKKTKNIVASNETYVLSQQDKEYNENIKKTKLYYGSYRSIPTENNPDGILEEQFKLIDNTISKDNLNDKRKNRYGKRISSFDKERLIEIAQDLGIVYKDETRFRKEELEIRIKEHLKNTNAILR